jgi:hypothetical protein
MTASDSVVIQVRVADIVVPEGMEIPTIKPNLLGMFRKNGIEKPLIISAENMLVDGVKRLAAARILGMETVPCIVGGTNEAAPVKPQTIRARAPGGWCSWTPPGTTECRRSYCVDAEGHRCMHYGGRS